MALDALERTRDDRPVRLSVRDLDIESAVSFRRAALERHPHWANLSEVNFLKRVLVLDDDEKVTRAGQLLLAAVPELSREENAPLRLKRGGRCVLFRTSGRPADMFFQNCWALSPKIAPARSASVS